MGWSDDMPPEVLADLDARFAGEEQSKMSKTDDVAEFRSAQPATYVGVDGDWNLACVIVGNVEGWWKVRFLQDRSEAIVRPSSLRARSVTLETGRGEG